ncbi:MAG: diaminopimelate epimerase [Candidatus Obscuribacterales bacterium]|nr:diaminopimelate epimerase [Candidatus Obscuribacterales bacterium]
MRFCKMQALGNDFVVVGEDELKRVLGSLKMLDGRPEDALLSQIAQKLCSRNFGIGADGFIVVRKGSSADRLSWTYINSDGSISLMCGNGLRCLALWAKMNAWAPGDNYFVETGKGPVEITYVNAGSISTDLGEPQLIPSMVPVADGGNQPVIAREFKQAGEQFKISCVSMGNPHCVIFENRFDDALLENRALKLQSNEFFPEGVNVEFVKVDSKTHLTVRVYERGCGRTLACASGAAATVVAAVLEGRTERKVDVELEGGTLQIEWQQDSKHVLISGPAAIVFSGQLDVQSLNLEAF